MIDTIHFTFESENIHKVLRDSEWVRGSQYQSSSINSYKVTDFLNINVIDQANSKFKVSFKGSIHKFCENGTNLKDFSFGQFEQAIIDIKRRLKFSLEEAHVTRVDFGFNLILKHSIRGYNSLLVCPKGFQEDSFNNKESLYYVRREGRTKREEIILYDKLSETYPKYKITKDLLKKNLMRIEQRILTKERLTSLGIETLSDLMKQKVQSALLDYWYTQVSAFEFNGKLILPVINKPEDVYNYLMSVGIKESGGQEDFLKLSKFRLRESGLSNSQVYRIRKRIKELPSFQKLKNESIREFKMKVQQKYLKTKKQLEM